MILVISSKKAYATKRLIEECRVRSVEFRVMDTQELVDCGFKADVKKFDVLYVRDPYLNTSPKYIPQIIKLAKKFKAAGKRVVDSTIVDGNLGQGKWVDYQILQKQRLQIPKTSVIASAAEAISYKNRLPRLSDALKARNDIVVYPFVLKWIYGMGGKNTFLIKDEHQLKKYLLLHPKQEWLVQEYIDADFEFEVYVVGFKAIPTILAYEIKDGFKANVKKFKVMRNVKDCARYNQLLKIAGKSAKVLGRELCKVDILERDGKFFILEVNRNPGLVSFESLLGYNMASEFVKYIIR